MGQTPIAACISKRAKEWHHPRCERLKRSQARLKQGLKSGILRQGVESYTYRLDNSHGFAGNTSGRHTNPVGSRLAGHTGNAAQVARYNMPEGGELCVQVFYPRPGWWNRLEQRRPKPLSQGASRSLNLLRNFHRPMCQYVSILLFFCLCVKLLHFKNIRCKHGLRGVFCLYFELGVP